MKVNIAIPCFNEEDSLRKCVESLQSLEGSYHISIYNDGSVDNSLQILNEYQNIRIISSKINFGLAEVFNSIIYDSKKENYDYLIIFDADSQPLY